MSAFRTPLAIWMLLVLMGPACSEAKRAVPDGSVDAVRDTGHDDGPRCVRPPFSLCSPPAPGACPTYWSCPNCSCTGGNRVAACDPISGDCRYFCTGCYPAEYVNCGDTTLSPSLLSRCGFCFLSDAGGPERCDKLRDAGP